MAGSGRAEVSADQLHAGADVRTHRAQGSAGHGNTGNEDFYEIP